MLFNRYHIGIIVLTLAFLNTGIVFAKESAFRPAMGDVSATFAGSERVTITQDGGVGVERYNGKQLRGFPVFAPDSVAASSPIVADVYGDNMNEVVFVARSVENAYALYAYNGSGIKVVSYSLGAFVPSEDLVVLHRTGGKDVVLIPTEQGSLLQIDFSQDLIVQTIIKNVGQPFAVAADASGTNLVFSYPNQKKLDFLTLQNGQWVAGNSIALGNEIIYAPAATFGAVYGIDALGRLVAYDWTGTLIEGFPAVLPSFPASGPFLSDADAAVPGQEITVTLTDGRNAVVTPSGLLLESRFGVKSLRSWSTDAADTISGGVFRATTNAGVIAHKTTGVTVVTPIGKPSLTLPNITAGEVAVKYNGNEIAVGGTVDAGTFLIGTTAEVSLKIENVGSADILLTGNPPVAFAGSGSAMFTITQTPALSIAPGGNALLIINFNAQSAGTHTLRVEIPTTDSDERLYSFTLQATAVEHLGAPTNLQALPDDSALRLSWSPPTATGLTAVTDYIVKYRVTGTAEYMVVSDGVSTSTNAIITGLHNGVTYDVVVQAVTIDGPGPETNSISATPAIPPLLLTDAEDGGTSGWFVSTDGAPSTITNENEGGTRGRVISLNGSGWGSVFLFKKPDGTLLNQSNYPVLSFDTTMESNYVSVNVDTDKSERSLTYMVYPTNTLVKPNYQFDGRAGIPDGTWRTITHDLQKDLSAVEPDTHILKVNAIAIRGSGKIDNVKLLASASVYTLSGKVTDENGAPLSGVTVSLLPTGRGAITGQDGIYRFVSLPPGAYDLTLSKTSYDFSGAKHADITNSNVDLPVQANTVNYVVYSDGEDGTTAGWTVSTDAAPSTISNIEEGGSYGKVISLNGSGWNSVFILKKPDGSWWNNVGYPVIEFDSNMESNIVYVRVDTSVGDKTLVYMPRDVADHGTGFSLQFDGRTGIADGAWRRVSHDLQTDLETAIPGARLLSVGGMFVRGSGKIDNVQLRLAATLHTVSGKVLDNNGTPISGALVTLSPRNLTVTTGLDGVYRFTGLFGDYTLTAQKDGYGFTPAALNGTADSNRAEQNFVGTQITSLMMDNAEDGDTAGWFVSTDSVATSSIDNTQTADTRGKVISLIGQGWNSVFLLKKPDNTWWNAKGFSSLRYDTTGAGVIVTVKINTNKGDRQIAYYPGETTNHGTSPYYRFDGRTDEPEGTWRTVTRNLQADLISLEPDILVTSVDGLGIRGTGQFDNVELLK